MFIVVEFIYYDERRGRVTTVFRRTKFNFLLMCLACFCLVGCVCFSLPQVASANEVVVTKTSTMTITLQEDDVTPDDADEDDDTDDSNDETTDETGDETTSNTTTNSKTKVKKVSNSVSSSEKGGGLPVTGDALAMALAGIVLVAGAAAYCLLQSKKLAPVRGAHVRRTASSIRRRKEEMEAARKKVVCVTLAAALLAAVCLGGFASKSSVLAEDVGDLVNCSSTVKVDATGKVASTSVTVENKSAKAIEVRDCAAPSELDGWVGNFSEATAQPNSTIAGAWVSSSGELTLPADIVQKVTNGETVTLTFNVEVTYDDGFANVTVSFHEADDAETAVSGMTPVTVLAGEKIEKPAATPTKDGYNFIGWFTDKALTNEFTFGSDGKSTVAITANTKLFAKWEEIDESTFWLSSTNTSGTQRSDFVNDPNYRSERKILADMEILHDSTNDNYASTLANWQAYYANGVKLYATYSGGETETDSAGATSDLNKLVEFRILEVSGASGHLNVAGDDASGDGSVVTFMATHTLPTAYQMNSSWTSDAIWSSSVLRDKLQSGGEIFAKFPENLTRNIKAVSKMNNAGGGAGQTAAGTTTQDAFWIISYNELTGSSQEYTPTNEGTQYAWCAANVGSGPQNNDSLVFTTRSGEAAGSFSAGAEGQLWERSPNVSHTRYFMRITNAGSPSTFGYADDFVGVAPAFCF